MRRSPPTAVPLALLVIGAVAAAARANACSNVTAPAYSPGSELLSQVHVSLGAYDRAADTWSVVVSFAATRGTAGVPTARVARSAAELDTCVRQFFGTATEYTYQVDPRLASVGFTNDGNRNYASPTLYHTTVQGIAPASVV